MKRNVMLLNLKGNYIVIVGKILIFCTLPSLAIIYYLTLGRFLHPTYLWLLSTPFLPLVIITSTYPWSLSIPNLHLVVIYILLTLCCFFTLPTSGLYLHPTYSWLLSTPYLPLVVIRSIPSPGRYVHPTYLGRFPT